MMPKPDQDSQDAAWVIIETPFAPQDLRLFLADIERLYRINPMLTFEDWQQTGEGEFLLRAKNANNGKLVDTRLTVARSEDGLDVRYANGLKTATTFRIEVRSGGGANLIVTDDYSGTPVAERESRMDEVDNSLIPWGEALHRYFRQWKRWSWLPGWKFYMRRVWQPMRPLARRIVFLLIVVTLLEFVVFLFVFTIYRLEMHKYMD